MGFSKTTKKESMGVEFDLVIVNIGTILTFERTSSQSYVTEVTPNIAKKLRK